MADGRLRMVLGLGRIRPGLPPVPLVSYNHFLQGVLAFFQSDGYGLFFPFTKQEIFLFSPAAGITENKGKCFFCFHADPEITRIISGDANGLTKDDNGNFG